MLHGFLVSARKTQCFFLANGNCLLAITGGCSLGKCDRLSQSFGAHYNIVTLTYLLTCCNDDTSNSNALSKDKIRNSRN